MSKSILRFMIPKSLVVYITQNCSVRQAFEKMSYHRYRAIPVLDDAGAYVGTLRNDDILNYIYNAGSFDKTMLESIPISELLDRAAVKPVAHNTSMRDLIESVKEHNFVSVVDDRGCFIGIVLRREILNHLLENYNEI